VRLPVDIFFANRETGHTDVNAQEAKEALPAAPESKRAEYERYLAKLEAAIEAARAESYGKSSPPWSSRSSGWNL
jgi:hypothetical protein